jgi:serine/threonine protein kinase
MTRTIEKSPGEAARVSSLGPWQLLELIDEGNYTLIYAACPKSAPDGEGADYVVKVIKPEYQGTAQIVRRLTTEAFLGRTVSHPNLASVLSANVDEPPFYLVQPYLDGSTLQTLSDNDRDLSLPFILWVVRQTAHGFKALHDRGWLHGDVNPTNIIVSPQGHATLIDLGMANQIDLSTQSNEELAGTLAYAAPEQFVPARGIGPFSDVYCLGIMLFEQLTGCLPFQVSDPVELAAAHLRLQPADPRSIRPQIPTRVNWLIKRMLAKEPLRRPTTEELIALLIQLEVEFFDERQFSDFCGAAC